MSDPNAPPDPTQPSLHFDTAEFASEESLSQEFSCAACRRPLAESDYYFEVGGQKMCPACKDAAITLRTGSGVAAFFRAWLYGAIAGIAGCGLYYAVLALTGWEVGLIAVVVGFIVGIAVRTGSRHRGGWLFQAMAMIITYGSIVTSYVPLVIADAPKDPENPLPLWFLIPFGWILAWFVPFLTLPQNIIGLFIIGIGIYEAWKINKRVPLLITGPYAVSASDAVEVSPQDDVDPPPPPPVS